jgi:hypothetical protein
VRGETERTSTLSDGVRTYYLATGALERALAYIEWGPSHRNPDNTPRYYEDGMGRLNFNFPSGVASVQVMPESAKFNINEITPPELMKLLVFLGAGPGPSPTGHRRHRRLAYPRVRPYSVRYAVLAGRADFPGTPRVT